MNREEAQQILASGGWLELWYDGTYKYFNNLQSMCSDHLEYLNGMSEYECCQSDYNSVEEMLDDIEHMCKGNWEEVS